MPIEETSIPPQPKTKELPAPTKTEIQIGEILVAVKNIADGQVKLQDGFENVVDRLGNVEGRVARLESRAATTSERVKGGSQTDLDHEAALAQEITAREALATKLDTCAKETTEKQDALAKVNEEQLDILRSVGRQAKALINHPAVKYAVAAIWTGLVAWLARKGFVVPQ
jgi:hypothetical protein